MTMNPPITAENYAPVTIQHRAPTVSLPAVRGMLGLTSVAVVRMIEDGRLSWAFNIAARDATRADYRVLALCIADYQRGVIHPVSWSEVLRLLYGHPRAAIHSSYFYRAWACRSDHFYALLGEGALEVVSPDWRCGPAGGAYVTWDSAVAFAKRCRVA